MAANPSRSPTQLGASGTRYGSATTARATSLFRIVWNSKSCARLDLPRLLWGSLLNSLGQLRGLLPAIYGCFGGAALRFCRRHWLADGSFPLSFRGGGAHAPSPFLWLTEAPSDSHRGHLSAEAGQPLARCPLSPHL